MEINLINLVIDNKEKAEFIAVVDKYITAFNNDSAAPLKITHKIGSLDVGDFAFYYGTELYLVIERKTIADLMSSISDGRYHEQKIRLITLRREAKCRVMYIVEGKMTPKFSYEKYMGCLIGTMARDEIPIFLTNTMDNTGQLIVDICKRIARYGLEDAKVKQAISSNQSLSDADVKYSNANAVAISTNKSENMTPKICFINQLVQIPRVSPAIAQKIVDQYNSPANLILAYQKLADNPPTARENMLAEIMVGKRKLGKVLSQRIYQFCGFPAGIH